MEDSISQISDWLAQLPAFLAYLGGVVVAVLGSSFAIALVGAFAGAYAGAVGAHRAIERSRSRAELLEEIRAINASLIVSLTICNTVLALKRQLVLPMLTRFSSDKSLFDEFLSQLNASQGQPLAPFHCQLDLISFSSPVLPLESLKELVYSKIGAYGKPLSLAAQIEGAAGGLSSAIASRNQQIQGFKSNSLQESERIFHYFGRPMPTGHTHREYSDTVDVIGSYTNDIIWFSYQLCLELAKFGRKKREAFSERYRKEAPAVSEPDFSGAIESGLIPPDTDYESWSNWIVER